MVIGTSDGALERLRGSIKSGTVTHIYDPTLVRLKRACVFKVSLDLERCSQLSYIMGLGFKNKQNKRERRTRLQIVKDFKPVP